MQCSKRSANLGQYIGGVTVPGSAPRSQIIRSGQRWSRTVQSGRVLRGVSTPRLRISPVRHRVGTALMDTPSPLARPYPNSTSWVNRTGFPGSSISWEDGVHGKTETVLTGGTGAGCVDVASPDFSPVRQRCWSSTRGEYCLGGPSLARRCCSVELQKHSVSRRKRTENRTWRNEHRTNAVSLVHSSQDQRTNTTRQGHLEN